ncbi:hypothetical protein OPV22_027369 [Ensete ventricosum]|uniref:Uncharacterized protein n=1 Tax=Ensete ventricosum TaxID=4639 RepID=A0AAV8P590_ENSVE|nr:hypothetical protein OPV22_027369 [Ensete ventricosum]
MTRSKRDLILEGDREEALEREERDTPRQNKEMAVEMRRVAAPTFRLSRCGTNNPSSDVSTSEPWLRIGSKGGCGRVLQPMRFSIDQRNLFAPLRQLCISTNDHNYLLIDVNHMIAGEGSPEASYGLVSFSVPHSDTLGELAKPNG